MTPGPVAGVVGEHQRPDVGPDLVDLDVRQPGLLLRLSVTASYSWPSIEAGFQKRNTSYFSLVALNVRYSRYLL